MKIGLVILTYNEIEGCREIIPKIPRNAVDEIFTVDGGSTDGTIEYLKEQKIVVVKQGEEKGRGAAFRIAFQHTNCDALIFFSPDGNETPADILKFRPLLEQGNDMVIASRMMKGAYNEEDDLTFRWRKWANLTFGWFANISFNKKTWVTDTINGFRAIKKDAFEKIKPDGHGYTIEYQMSIRAMKAKLKIAEFPTYEDQRIGGESYAKAIPTGLVFIKMYFKEFLS